MRPALRIRPRLRLRIAIRRERPIPVATTEDKARFILMAYRNYKSKPGHILLPTNFRHFATRKRIALPVIDEGLAEALRLGWIEPVFGGHRLTDAGFACFSPRRPRLPVRAGG